MDALKKAELNLEAQGRKWVQINHSAMAIALHRYYGYGCKRLKELEQQIEDAWNECASYGRDKSMMEMLEEETGIEIRNPDVNKSWHDLAYFNSNIKMDAKKMNRAQWIYMRQEQAKWMRQQTMAIILLGMHRTQGFAFDRLARLSAQIDEVVEEFERDPKKILQAALEEANFRPKT